MPYVAYDFKPSPNLTNTISWVLSISASSAQGLMSLGGTLAIWPTSIIWGLCAFGLTVAYEGEVNAQNSKGAIEKLTDPHYAKTQLMKQYLREKFATFDQDRARFTTSNTLTTDEKKKVCLLHEVVILKQDTGYKIGFCGKDGKYCEKDIQNHDAFLDDFQDDVFFEDDNHIIQLNDILKNLTPSVRSTPLKKTIHSMPNNTSLNWYIGINLNCNAMSNDRTTKMDKRFRR